MNTIKPNNPSGLNPNPAFDLADNCRELAAKINEYKNKSGDNLSESDRTNLQTLSDSIRVHARTLANVAGVDLLQSLQRQLEKLCGEVNEINNFLDDVSSTRQVISTASIIADTLADVVKSVTRP